MKNIDFKSIFIFLALICLIFFSVCTAGASEGNHTVYTKDQTAEFFKSFDEVQKQTNTIQAAFVEKKELKLLEEPVVSRGKFYYTRPNQILWEYQQPEEKKFLLTKNTILSYYPKEKKAEQVNIRKFSKRVFKFFAVGVPSKDLKDYYDIELSNNNNSKRVLMTLQPKKRGVKKRVEVVRLWVDKSTFLPHQIQWVEVDGDKTTITFDNVKSNAEIGPDIYKLDIPPDVKITEGFSEFSDKKQE